MARPTARQMAHARDVWAGPTRSRRARAQSETQIALIRLAGVWQREFAELFKQYELSPPQYNVLRILRGAGDAGLMCGQVAERLIQHDPDVTRLLDRLTARGLVARTRDERDRRVVRTSITAEGLALLASLDGPVDELHERQMGHVPEARLRQLRLLMSELAAGSDGTR